MKDWWTADDAKAFAERAACFVGFQKAFSCKPEAPMVRANACRVW